MRRTQRYHTHQWGIFRLQSRIALVAIANGLGHLRRQLILYRYLVEVGEDVTLFCNTSDLKKLTTDLDINASNLIIRVEDLENNTNTTFFESLKPLFQSFDYVISDNCIDILQARSDAILYSSFFWHRSIKMPKAYSNKCERLLAKYDTLIFADRLFKAPYLSEYKNVIEIGLFGSSNCNSQDKSDLLISFGHGDNVSNIFLDVASKAIKVAAKSDIKVWLEPRYFSKLAGENTQIATYSREMFSNILLGIVRPGVGTLTELIAARSYALMFYEQSNLEMSHNASVMNSLGCGIDVTEEVRFESLLLNQLSNSATICPDYSNQFTGPEDLYREIKDRG